MTTEFLTFVISGCTLAVIANNLYHTVSQAQTLSLSLATCPISLLIGDHNLSIMPPGTARRGLDIQVLLVDLDA